MAAGVSAGGSRPRAAPGAAGAVETPRTLRDNGLHPAQDSAGVAPHVVAEPGGASLGGARIRASGGRWEDDHEGSGVAREEKGEKYLARLETRMTRGVPAAARGQGAQGGGGGGEARRQGAGGVRAPARPQGTARWRSLRLQGPVEGGEEVGDDFVKAVELALANLKAFHEPQMPKGYTIEQDGGDLGIRVRPIESVGVYVPGGSAVYLSSLLMAVVPARIAGVPRIAVATPPRAFLSSPQLRYLLDRLDLHEVYLMGGAHAIAALAYGTDSVTPVDKIVGAGGRWCAAAKRARVRHRGHRRRRRAPRRW